MIKNRSGYHRRDGFSLIELLVVTAIILILVAIVSTVAVQAKKSVGKTVEISNLRQLGAAAAIYSETYDRWPIAASTIVTDSRVPKSLVHSPLDFTQFGLTNEIIRYHARWLSNLRPLIPPYPVSFTGLGDLGYQHDYFETRIKSEPGAGWLISLVESKPLGQDSYGRFQGVYRRLLLDGSVQRRSHIEFGPDRAQHPAFWFADGDDNWKSDIISR